jgi:hypothetical protein
MSPARRCTRLAVSVGAGGVLLGLVLAGASAVAAGDWYLARQPWIGLGIALITWCLAFTDIALLQLVIVEPLGWWRLLAVPPALYLAFYWALYLLIGAPTTAPGSGAEHDVGTVFYSHPPTMVIFLGVTVLLALPFGASTLAHRLRRPAGGLPAA